MIGVKHDLFKPSLRLEELYLKKSQEVVGVQEVDQNDKNSGLNF